MSDPADVLALVYGFALLLVAYLIDLSARRSASKTTEYRSGAFVYNEDHDAWLCPNDEWLWPQSFDPDNRVMRYRGKAQICNSCQIKSTCTTSDTGREVQRMVDPWPSSESAKFHRGIACTVAVLAFAWPFAQTIATDGAQATVILGLASLLIALGALPLFAHLRRTPAEFPDGIPVKTLDEVEEAKAIAAAREKRRRSGYRSEKEAGSAFRSDREKSSAFRSDRAPVRLGWPGRPGETDPDPLLTPDQVAATNPTRADRDRFAAAWGSFSTDEEATSRAGWSRRRKS